MLLLRWRPSPPTSFPLLERRKDSPIIKFSMGTDSGGGGGEGAGGDGDRCVSIGVGRRTVSGFGFATISGYCLSASLRQVHLYRCVSASFQQVRKVGRARFSFSSSWAQHPQECGVGGGDGGQGAWTFSSVSAVPQILPSATGRRRRRQRLLPVELVVVSQSSKKKGARACGGDDRVQTDEKQQQQQQKEMLVNQKHEVRAAWESPWDDNGPSPPSPEEQQRQHTRCIVGESVEEFVDYQRERAPLEQTRQTQEVLSAAVQISQSPSTTRRNLESEMKMGVRAVQLACLLSQRTQQRVLQMEEKADEKMDRSVVTVADWGVQAVVSWVLAQGSKERESRGRGGDVTPAIPMIAEEDTKGLRGRDKIDLLGRVVDAVNHCLEEAPVVGISPPPKPLSAMDVLKAISKGSAEGGQKGRYWVLDPVDGTLGFVRGDQYAIALALLEDGEVVLAILGCPNFPLRKQWLRYHHRYYRLASKLNPPNRGAWHKGIILTTSKGAGRVMMQPLLFSLDGRPQLDKERQAPQEVHVSLIDDPALATFCEPFEQANSSHSFTAGLAQSLGLRKSSFRPKLKAEWKL